MVRGVGRVVDGDSDQVSVAALIQIANLICHIAVHAGEEEMCLQCVN